MLFSMDDKTSIIEPPSHDPETGKFAKGNRLSPGRPKGSIHKLTALKHEILNEDSQKKIVGVFREMLESPKEGTRLEALKIAVQLIPREDRIQHEIAQLTLQKVVHAKAYTGPITCPKCNHSIDLDDNGQPKPCWFT